MEECDNDLNMCLDRSGLIERRIHGYQVESRISYSYMHRFHIELCGIKTSSGERNIVLNKLNLLAWARGFTRKMLNDLDVEFSISCDNIMEQDHKYRRLEDERVSINERIKNYTDQLERVRGELSALGYK